MHFFECYPTLGLTTPFTEHELGSYASSSFPALQTFDLFPRLPAELQLMIWEAYLGDYEVELRDAVCRPIPSTWTLGYRIKDFGRTPARPHPHFHLFIDLSRSVRRFQAFCPLLSVNRQARRLTFRFSPAFRYDMVPYYTDDDCLPDRHLRPVFPYCHPTTTPDLRQRAGLMLKRYPPPPSPAGFVFVQAGAEIRLSLYRFSRDLRIWEDLYCNGWYAQSVTFEAMDLAPGVVLPWNNSPDAGLSGPLKRLSTGTRWPTEARTFRSLECRPWWFLEKDRDGEDGKNNEKKGGDQGR